MVCIYVCVSLCVCVCVYLCVYVCERVRVHIWVSNRWNNWHVLKKKA